MTDQVVRPRSGAEAGAYAQGVLDGRLQERERIHALAGWELANEVFPTDGPYDSQRTVKAAAVLAELLRYLNYATMPKGGVEYPATVYDLIGNLQTAMERLPQLLGQMTDRLHEQATREGTYVNNPRPEDRRWANRANAPETAVAAAAPLAEVARLAAAMRPYLTDAHVYTGRIGVYTPPDEDDEEPSG